MATIYKVKIKTVSPWISFNEEYMEKMFEKFLKEYKDEKTGLGFECTEIEVKRI
jgi:hypothetical protein